MRKQVSLLVTCALQPGKQKLVRINESDVPVTDSLIVAEAFGKRHDNVLAKVDKLLETEDPNAPNFKGVKY